MAKIPRRNHRDPLVQIGIRIPMSLDRAIEIEAAKRSVQKQKLVEMAVRSFLRIPEAA